MKDTMEMCLDKNNTSRARFHRHCVIIPAGIIIPGEMMELREKRERRRRSCCC